MFGLSLNSREYFSHDMYEDSKVICIEKFKKLFRTMDLVKVQAYAEGGFNSCHRAAAEAVIATGDVDADRIAILQNGLDNEESKRFCGVC